MLFTDSSEPKHSLSNSMSEDQEHRRVVQAAFILIGLQASLV